MARKKLPIGIQTFAKIREDDAYYYVDKTAFALRLIAQGSHYFLSRPRRFGKSLFLDTLKELFEGNAPLFSGLHAESAWDWTVCHPVLRFSFGGGVIRDAEDLQASLHEQLSVLEQVHGTGSSFPDVRSRFKTLIRHCAETTGQRVVVLIDEYDKPILDRIEQPELARVIREELKDFYSVIKDSDAHIRFAFLTGVSKFSKVSLFSGLNNLEDITVSARYSALCGYTDSDVDSVFAPELEGLDRDEIRRWYNGYNWTGESVYNPFDLLLLFRNRQFAPYWFESGTPSFLVKLLARQHFFTPDLARLQSSEALLSTFDVDHMVPEALLFQAGYLTVHGHHQPLPGQWVFELGYPNKEVESSLNASLLGGLGATERQSFNNRLKLVERLHANDFAGLHKLFNAFFASIPHDWYRNNPIAQYEGYWASVFYSHFAALGLDIILEDTTSQGRIDMTVRFNDNLYLFEFKVVEIEPEGQALSQIKARNYSDKYRAEQQPIHLIGVEFSRDSRSVVAFAVESLVVG